MSEPIAVCISDIHFNINILSIASTALQAALSKAEQLDVPLVIAGDLNDTKAIIRAEVANKIISILEDAAVEIIILEGNHDKINEKSSEHGLNYLRPYATIVDSTRSVSRLNFVPYQSSNKEFLKQIDRHDGIVICHQGFLGAYMGDYIQDKSSVSPEAVKNVRIISGHYHRHQTLGTVTYIGSPYTITFGEANDGPKGFIVLNSNGTFTREILNLRKHVILERTVSHLTTPASDINPGDLVWLKVKGPYSELQKINKKQIGEQLFGHNNFKLDLISTDSLPSNVFVETMTPDVMFDTLIDSLEESDEQKNYLKSLWRELV